LGGDGFEMAESFEAPGLMFLRDGGEMGAHMRAALALLEKPAGAQLSVYRPGELLQNPTSIQNRLSDAFRVEAAAIDEELGADGVLHILGGRSLREVRCECPVPRLSTPDEPRRWCHGDRNAAATASFDSSPYRELAVHDQMAFVA
jgi:hypothetical protein